MTAANDGMCCNILGLWHAQVGQHNVPMQCLLRGSGACVLMNGWAYSETPRAWPCRYRKRGVNDAGRVANEV